MPCYNCGKPAMFVMEDANGAKIPICLDCRMKLLHVQQAQFDMCARMVNWAAEHMDNVLPIGSPTPRIAMSKPVIVQHGGITLNNIKVDNSTIGVLNTGSLEMVDSAVSVLHQAGDDKLGQAVQEFTQAVVSAKDLDAKQKNELLSLLSVIASEATAPSDQRRSAAMWPIIEKLAILAGGIASLAEIWERVGPILRAVFPQ